MHNIYKWITPTSPVHMVVVIDISEESARERALAEFDTSMGETIDWIQKNPPLVFPVDESRTLAVVWNGA